MRNIKYIFFILIAFFFTACSQKITIKSLHPASVGDKDIKHVSVEDFKNDSILLKNIIVSKMNEIKFDNKKYFNIVNRKDTDKILEEQKLQDSGLVKTLENKDFAISDINSIISGEINSKTHNKSYYNVTRTDYSKCIEYYNEDKKSCKKYYKYKVKCESNVYNVSTNVEITRVNNADVIFSKVFNLSTKQNKCRDESKRLYSSQTIFEDLSTDIANQFIKLIAPSYKYVAIELMEEEDIDYTDFQSNLLENSLKLIELMDISSANALLKKLVNSTNYKSSTALYNFAITYEFLGELDEANIYYQKAKNITMQNDMNELIIYSANRIKKVIEDNQIAMNQIK